MTRSKAATPTATPTGTPTGDTTPGEIHQPDPGERSRSADSSEFDGWGYEKARDALVEVVRRLEAGGVPLEESLTLWERGEALARYCERWLSETQNRITESGAQLTRNT